MEYAQGVATIAVNVPQVMKIPVQHVIPLGIDIIPLIPGAPVKMGTMMMDPPKHVSVKTNNYL